MALVTSLQARWILDSRGFPTVQCTITIDQNGKKAIATASVPSGASTGTHEALELRDGTREFHGKGVTKAVENINSTISAGIGGRSFATAVELEQTLLSLDTSSNKSELGANAILAVSMASHRAFAELAGLELWQYLRRLYFSTLPATSTFPRLMCNVLNGGVHADSGLSIQEFMIVPNTGSIEKDIQAASEIYHTLKKSLAQDGQSTSLGDEGGFAPKLSSSESALEFIQQAIVDAGYSRDNCNTALDAASSEFYDKRSDTYNVDGSEMSKDKLVNFYHNLEQNYGLISIEDGFAEDDVEGWQKLTQSLGATTHLIGDDLFVTNTKRFEEIGIANGIANGVLIKLNQIGSVLETCDIINKAKSNNYITIVSHRSGETTDSFMSDLAYASQSEFIKLGAPARGERVAKFNRLLDINDSLI